MRRPNARTLKKCYRSSGLWANYCWKPTSIFFFTQDGKQIRGVFPGGVCFQTLDQLKNGLCFHVSLLFAFSSKIFLYSPKTLDWGAVICSYLESSLLPLWEVFFLCLKARLWITLWIGCISHRLRGEANTFKNPKAVITRDVNFNLIFFCAAECHGYAAVKPDEGNIWQQSENSTAFTIIFA